MDLSIKWLKDYVDADCDMRAFAEAMTMTGSKVEKYETEGENIDKVVVGKVLSLEKHPDADKLTVCQIDVGDSSPIQIVTGATNLTVGDLVPVALDGSTLPDKKITKGKLRGVESFGMLCSLEELELTKNDFPYAIEDGIFVLEEDCEAGQDIQSAIGLNDTSVEFEITSNRPDCMSVIGLAREASATFDVPLKLKAPVVKAGHGDGSKLLKVSIEDSDLCSRYAARIVKNVRIAPSPRWLIERLRASGVRPINNIVDITNYVCLEYGHPMHAFDHRYIENEEIIVRRARQGENITTLDGVERALDNSMLVIADGKKPVAVAGVMGGEFSGIMDDTYTIVFESACFSGSSVRITAKKLGMRTDASSRFEKGLDPQNCLPALERACELVELLNAGDVMDTIIDCDKSVKAPTVIALEYDWINSFLGTDISKERMVEILTKLGFSVDGDSVTVPSFRTDVTHKADISEEIARIYGYNNIPSTIMGSSTRGRLSGTQAFNRSVHESLIGQGMSEIMTYSFISPKYYDKILMEAGSPLRDSVTITNPLGEDTSIMRTTALPSLLEVLSRNYNNRNTEARGFEIATVYIKKSENELPVEKDNIMVGLYGQNTDFYDIKGIVEELLENVSVKDYTFTQRSDSSFHPGRCAAVEANGQTLGIVGELHPLVLENYEIGVKVYAASLDFNTLFALRETSKQYTPLPKYPAVARDLALICDDVLSVGALQETVKSAAGKLLESIQLFDVYKGKQIEEGKKSVAFSLVLRSKEETLTDERVESVMKKILKALDAVGVSLR